MSSTALHAAGIAPACAPRQPDPILRLTRRGRAVVVLILLAVAFCVLALRSAPAASTDVVHHPSTATVVVAPGDTLWDIARRVSPSSDPRSVVAEIEDLN